MYVSYVVQIESHDGAFRVYSQHHKALPAVRSAARAHRRLRPNSIRIWCAEDNRGWSPDGFSAAVERGDYV
jgi:hypothetical protein